jgi:hypothetical protein
VITFQYFKNCPHSAETLRNLLELAKDNLIPENEVHVIEVPDLASAEEHHFQGSPTILMDGVDIVTLKKPEGFNYACRIYEFNGARTGASPRNTSNQN